ncbi:hypothetical protein N825_09190 [Skermanella stibiiresistens SB22]|uniref:Molybdate ABC transporter substrate-binding protein n=1 Tax=Skermanella stibiiresistens SB22 TaxID=1385369 RepID=W9GVD0_9PROT|nr:hypothetical protein N825_09190 [Skermanella stibiiresistens SB22]
MPPPTDSVPVINAKPIRLHAAGSLKAALSEVASAYTAETGAPVEAMFGSSGLIRRRLERGELGDIFASADLGNPMTLSHLGLAGPVVLFARNHLCAIVRPGLELTPRTLLTSLLDPSIKLATSTPGADPSGDYAWAMFAKAEAVLPGSRERLEAKALTLTGGPNSPHPPVGRTVYGWHIQEGRSDVFLTYHTAARHVPSELPGATVVELPPELGVAAEYGLTVMENADRAKALPLVLYIMSPPGQRILARHGFAVAGIPDGLHGGG